MTAQDLAGGLIALLLCLYLLWTLLSPEDF